MRESHDFLKPENLIHGSIRVLMFVKVQDSK
jgi:hypothetical protein